MQLRFCVADFLGVEGPWIDGEAGKVGRQPGDSLEGRRKWRNWWSQEITTERKAALGQKRVHMVGELTEAIRLR